MPEARRRTALELHLAANRDLWETLLGHGLVPGSTTTCGVLFRVSGDRSRAERLAARLTTLGLHGVEVELERAHYLRRKLGWIVNGSTRLADVNLWALNRLTAQMSDLAAATGSKLASVVPYPPSWED